MKSEEAIQKALEGGWEPEGCDFTDMPIERRGLITLEGEDEGWIGIYDREYPEEGYFYSFLPIMAFLDRCFWQSLGKALRRQPDKKCSLHRGEKFYRRRIWLNRWHRFIDLLAEGRTAESFFKNLN